jgi:polyhydroxybutyrate depolymerase
VNPTSRYARVVARLVAAVALASTAVLLVGCATAHTDVATTVANASISAGTAQTILTVGDLERSVSIRDVEASAASLVPALVLLHGATGSSQRMELGTGMTELAAANGFVVAYPDGTTTGMPIGGLSWNAGGCCAAAVTNDIDDISFVEAIIDELVENHGVDPERVYLGGFSNGGMMSYRSACEIGDRLAGIVVVGGAFNVEGCEAPVALPVLVIHGTADTTVPYNGGAPSAASAEKIGSWINAPLSDATDFWSERNGCTSEKTETAGTVTDAAYTGCSDGSSLEVVSVTGGTHRWPTDETEGFDASSFIVGYFGLAA